jgi:deoxyribodipyrimidine photo-lyase
MRTAVVLFNRDLRVHDHPALAEAVRVAERVVPLFVLDDGILRSGFARPNRLRFMLESLRALDGALAEGGGRLVVRRGDVVREAMRVVEDTGADAVFASADVSAYAQARERRLGRERIDFRTFPGTTVVPPGDLLPAGGDHFRVFTPYWRQWSAEPRRAVERAPRKIALPPRLAIGRVPRLDELTRDRPSPELPEGGEAAARRRLAAWVRGGLEHYGERNDELAADATSRLSPYLRFGCVSPLEVVERVDGRPGAEAFVRQLCWRDFYQQVTAAQPEWAHEDYRPRAVGWADDEEALDAWKAGLTGYPVVDAGMRQLAREGWMHNRARLIVGSFLTKDLKIDWRLGAEHFWDLLVDGEIANNTGNWQWVAGTGNDTRPNRVLNPVAQAKRHDPGGEYVRRYVPELAGVEGPAVHEPWKVDGLDYPAPIVEHAEAARAFRSGRLRPEPQLF